MIPFRKMNGLGNDFVVIDARGGAVALPPERIVALADRRDGIGFDQLVVIEPSRRADAFMRIANADGSAAEACGNATRCVAGLLLGESGAGRALIDSAGGLLEARRDGGWIAVDMGVPRFAAQEIPVAATVADPLRLVFPEPDLAALGPAACVGVGNPHAVFFVADAHAVPLADVGPRLERHALFPRRANISFATVETPARVRARVWERGVGATLACGTAACAVAAAGHRLGHLGEDVEVVLPGGTLRIGLAGGRIVMAGPWSLDWTGRITATGFERDGTAAGGQRAVGS